MPSLFLRFSVLLCILVFQISEIGAFNVTKMTKLIGQNCSAELGIPIQALVEEVASVENATSDSTECPPWFIGDQNRRLCKTGPDLGGIVYQDKETLQTQLLECNCMTVTPDNSSLAVGACLYTCNAINGYFPLPCNTSHLNHYMCSDLNRNGQLCGECKEGFIPLTMFFVIVAAFSISFTSPLISSVVLVYQLVANELQMRILLSFVESGLLVLHHKTASIISSIVGVWSLDFFRLAYDPFCLHPNMTTLQTLAMEYAIAVYPILLIMLTYILIRLHISGCILIKWAWMPFICFLRYFKKQWNIKTSLIDVFASFIFLSTSRIQITSFNFLMPTYVHTMPINDNATQPTTKLYLFSAPSVEYFGREHFPFAVLALIVLLTLAVLPMILLFVYPFRCFQKLLNRYNLNSHVLRTFMDVFQGSFKDGTEGTRDYRSFSALLLLPGLIISLIFSQTLSSYFYPTATMFIVVYWGLFIIFQPYRHRRHNYITTSMAVAFLCTYLGLMMNIQAVAGFNWSLVASDVEKKSMFDVSMVISLVLMYTGMSIPSLYIVVLAVVLVCIKIAVFRRCCNQEITHRALNNSC